MARVSAYHFFLKHAGYSYDPKAETASQGRIRCAQSLARAEFTARELGYSFEWSVDDTDSSEWSDETPAWAQWVCVMRDQNGKIESSLGGVDFGRDGDPWGNPYRRVVEAELALEIDTDTDDVLQEQNSNYNRMIGESLRRA